MTDTKTHCSVDYHKFNGNDLDGKAHLVSEGIYTNTTTFVSPPFTQTAFDLLVSDHHAKYEAYKNGGKAQKGAYTTSRTALINAMDTTGEYVDELPGVDEDMILLAGYTPTKIGESKAVIPDTTEVESIERKGKGVLEPTCKAVAGAKYYGCIVLDKPWDSSLIFIDGQLVLNKFTGEFRHFVTKGRKKTVTNLTSGKEYWFYFYSGNAAGVSLIGPGASEVCG